jgi:broad specificity phosphatase PhoE
MFGRVDLALDELREAKLPDLPPCRLRLPVTVWIVAARLAWLAGRGAGCESRRRFQARVHSAAERLAELNALHPSVSVVAHGVSNRALAEALRGLGYVGPRAPSSRHWRGALYCREAGPHAGS